MIARQKRLEKKYEQKINDLLVKMKDNTMTELWVELDKLKAEFKKEADERGINLE